MPAGLLPPNQSQPARDFHIAAGLRVEPTMSDTPPLHAVPSATSLPQRGVLITARPAAWQSLGISVATAAAVLVPAISPVAAPVLYAVCAVRLRRVRL